jgi:hypothetical protein
MSDETHVKGGASLQEMNAQKVLEERGFKFNYEGTEGKHDNGSTAKITPSNPTSFRKPGIHIETQAEDNSPPNITSFIAAKRPGVAFGNSNDGLVDQTVIDTIIDRVSASSGITHGKADTRPILPPRSPERKALLTELDRQASKASATVKVLQDEQIETIREMAGHPPEKTQPQRTVPESVLFHIQNVRDYYMKHMANEAFNVAQFRMAKLPFKRIVFSYDHHFNKSGAEIIQVRRVTRHVTVALSEHSTADLIDHVYRTNVPNAGELIHDIHMVSAHVIIQAHVAVENRSLPGRWFVFTDKDGQVLSIESRGLGWLWLRNAEETQTIARIAKGFYEFHPDTSLKQGEQALEDTLCRHGCISLMALQFLNCKNVEVLDNPPSRQVRRACERSGAKPPVTYKTLIIHPLNQKRATVKNPDGSAMHGVSLHIVRGHFRDYRQGAGLGRNHAHGLFWCSPHLRGQEEHGRVEKDYEVEPGE